MFGMDSVKLILVASTVLLVVSVGFYFYQSYSLDGLSSDSAYCFNRVLPEIGEISQAIRLKQEELNKDQKRGIETNRYVEKRAYESGIRYDFLTLGQPREYPNNREGYIDVKSEISPAGKRGSQSFDRRDIVKFLFYLEGRTNGLKVTSLLLDRPSEDREKWSMRLEITERKPLKKTTP